MERVCQALHYSREGLLDRSWIAGVLPSEVLISHVVTQFLILLGQTAITLVFILLVFGIPCKGPVGWLIGLTLLQGTAGMCYGEQPKLIGRLDSHLPVALCSPGLLLSTLFTDLATSMQMAIGSFYPCLLLSGEYCTVISVGTMCGEVDEHKLMCRTYMRHT